MSAPVKSEQQFAASQAYIKEAADLIPGAVNSNVRLASFPHPLCFERGEGAYLFDLDGNRFIDYALGMGPTIHGHAPKTICDAVAKSLARGQMLGGQHPLELTLARMMTQAIPSAQKVRIGLTGSEVVQAALRVSRAFTRKRKIIKFEGQYHGWFDNVLLSVAPPLANTAAEVAAPYEPYLESAGQAESVCDDVLVLPWNDATLVENILDKQGNDIAAIITEPAMCNTGAIAPAEGYLKALRALATRHKVVLIFDEVVTGFRLGLGGAQERFGVTPDLSTFAKAMAGGFPIAALVGHHSIMDMFGTGKVNHSGTYNSNIPSIAAAIASLQILAANGGEVLQTLEQTGQELMESIANTAAQVGSNLRVSGFGSCFNTYFSDDDEVVDYRSYRRTDLAKQGQFLQLLLMEGIRPTSRGTWFVSTAHSSVDTEETVKAVTDALKSLETYSGDETGLSENAQLKTDGS